MLESFPDLADVIEIVVESKAQHEEAWAGQVGDVWHTGIASPLHCTISPFLKGGGVPMTQVLHCNVMYCIALRRIAL